MLAQLGVQVLGVLATLVWSALASYLIVMGVQASVGLRVSEDDEVKGLDITTHGESGYRL
jgi:Amt family ammonium transporter